MDSLDILDQQCKYLAVDRNNLALEWAEYFQRKNRPLQLNSNGSPFRPVERSDLDSEFFPGHRTDGEMEEYIEVKPPVLLAQD